MKKKWVELKAEIRHIWKCNKCGKEVDVESSFYQESGTPICYGNPDCDGDDMYYVRTEILK